MGVKPLANRCAFVNLFAGRTKFFRGVRETPVGLKESSRVTASDEPCVGVATALVARASDNATLVRRRRIDILAS